MVRKVSKVIDSIVNYRKKQKSDLSQDQGVTLIEFTLVAIIFYASLAFLLDFALVVFQHSVLRYTVNKCVRELSTNVLAHRTPASLESATVKKAKQVLKESFGLETRHSRIVAEVKSRRVSEVSSQRTYSLLLYIEQPALCVFCLYPFNSGIQTAAQHMGINDKCFSG